MAKEPTMEEILGAYAAAVADVVSLAVVEARTAVQLMENKGLLSKGEFSRMLQEIPESLHESMAQEVHSQLMKRIEQYLSGG
jgi:hypothetical protein